MICRRFPRRHTHRVARIDNIRQNARKEQARALLARHFRPIEGHFEEQLYLPNSPRGPTVVSHTMAHPSVKLPATLALAGAVLGLVFAGYSTLDYADHLDRGVHDLHCSIIPGVAPTDNAEACRAAMYSPYAAVAKASIWGGVPISLFALGAFSFFAAFALYLLVQDRNASARSRQFFAVVSLTPLLVSLVMFVLALTQLGALCKTCVGIYLSSALLALGGAWIGASARRLAKPPLQSHALLWATAGLSALALSTLVPAAAYAATVPDHSPYISDCGSIKVPPTEKNELLPLVGKSAKRDALFIEDPLCPTCRAFHDRLVGEDVIDHVNAQVVLFPLDSECNWMLGEPLHPGACILSRALLCAEDPRAALEWAFHDQAELAQAGKAGPKALMQKITAKMGSKVTDCMNSTKTKQRLNKHLHYAAENNIPLSTPQMYLGNDRICDEDTDIGLRFTLKHRAPELVQ